jgi:hypothetical protein
MMQRIALVTILLVASSGCSVVVSNTLEMKGDSGGGGDTGTGECGRVCDDNDPCNGDEECRPESPDADEDGCVLNNPALPDGSECGIDGVGGICEEGHCARCGDSMVNGDEQCDDGRDGDDEDGCTDECRWSCEVDDDCNDGFECNGVESCITSGPLRLCSEGTLPLDRSPCVYRDTMEDGLCIVPTDRDEQFCCIFNDMMMPMICCDANACDLPPPPPP